MVLVMTLVIVDNRLAIAILDVITVIVILRGMTPCTYHQCQLQDG